jgi:hypothetical protein
MLEPIEGLPDPWHTLRLVAPLLFVIGVLFAEITFVRAYDGGKAGYEAAGLAIAVTLGLLALLASSAPLSRWLWSIRKRVLRLDAQGIHCFRSTKRPRCGWRSVKQISMHFFPPQPELIHVVVEGWETKVLRRGHILLENRSDAEELLAALRSRRACDGLDFVLFAEWERAWPSPPKVERPGGQFPVWALSLGLFFFVHGAPLLAVGLTNGTEHREPQRSGTKDSRLAAVAKPWLTAFESVEAFRAWLIGVGGTLTAVGVILGLVGTREPKLVPKQDDRSRAEQRG